MPFTKLDSEFASSSIFRLGLEVVGFWAYLLSQADSEGRVSATVPDMAARCRIPESRVIEILDLLQKPDEWSRTPDNDGRRVVVERQPRWSVILLNHQQFRRRDETNAERQQRFRDRQKEALRNVTPVTQRDASASASIASESVNQNLVEKPEAGEFFPRRPPPKANPLVADRRPQLEQECEALARAIAKLTGEDPIDVMAGGSHYEGAQRSALNPASMSDDRLANTVRDLRRDLAALNKRRDHGTPIRS